MTDEPNPSDIFRIRLREAREKLRKMSQSELAEKAKMPPSSVAHFESGARKPSFDTLRRVATALEVTTDYLLGRVDDPALAEGGDPLFRDMGKLTAQDRDTARIFIQALAEREAKKKG
jgi:transcriptional regulator with XRE-family HTH domain